MVSRAIGERPIIVCATGGSGTRALVDFYHKAGKFCGATLNHAGDSLPFVGFLEQFVDPVLRAVGRLDYEADDLPLELRRPLFASFGEALTAHHGAGTRPHSWVVKNPRQIFFGPAWHKVFPQARVLHIVRDGRDMVLSRNQNQPRKHYQSLFREHFNDERGQRARFWAVTNTQLHAYGRRCGDRYLCLKIEDLCKEGSASREHLAHFSGLDFADLQDAFRAFQAQRGFGRGKHLSPTRLDPAFAPALALFGYES